VTAHLRGLLNRIPPVRLVGATEALVQRILLAAILWGVFSGPPLPYPNLPEPVGLARWSSLWQSLGWDLSRFSDPHVWSTTRTIVSITLVAYVAGLGLPIAVPILALLHIGIRTVVNSQGAPHHGHQILSLVLIAQWLVLWSCAAARLTARLHSSSPPPWAQPKRLHSWIWLYSIAAAAVTYPISVVTKLDVSRGKWLENSHYVAAQIVKTNREGYYNSLDPSLLNGVPLARAASDNPAHDRYRYPVPVQAAWLKDHRALARTLFGIGFLLEACAGLAILSRWFAFWIGLGFVSLHASIGWLMALYFPLNEWLMAIYFLNAAGWIAAFRSRELTRPSTTTWIAATILTSAAFAASALPSLSPTATGMLRVTIAPASSLSAILSPVTPATLAPLNLALGFAFQTIITTVAFSGLLSAWRLLASRFRRPASQG
jgi:ABC-type iron transport system FetAB permease component